MKEFDFDELDKAVNSLMADVKKAEPAPQPTDQAPSPVVPSPSPTPVSPSPESAVPVPTSHVVTPVDPAPAPSVPSVVTPPARPARSLTPQRSGRFMDVVHPSSDMKTSSLPSREGVSLQPLGSTPQAASSPRPTSPVIDMVAPASTSAPSVPAISGVDETKENEPEEEPVQTATQVNEPWAPSPFLPDAQVEKRPLGGASSAPAVDTGLSESIAAELSKELSASDAEPASSEEAVLPAKEDVPVTESSSEAATKDESSEDSSPEDDPQLQAAPQKEAVALPAELDTNLVAIESGHVESSEDHISQPSSAATVLSASSIPQQYDEQPTSGDTSHTPIYDNEAVHQPLAHPAKKKSGWVFVIFIIGILIIGGGLGAAAYFLGLL